MQGKHVAITGASSGFGAHFAHLLAGEGAQVSLGARRLDSLAEHVAEINKAGH
jgi:NAD(P)-dependent dehydrogenase (short-subunit alcohol dehydrogenase family)